MQGHRRSHGAGEGARARVRREPEEALESGASLVGSETEIIEQLHKRRERWELSYVVVGDENIDEFAPIVAKLTGS